MPGQYGGAMQKKKGPSTAIIALVVIIALLAIAGGLGIASKGTFFIPGKADKTNSSDSSIPVISSFKTSASSIGAGDTVTLTWNVTGATTVSIDQGIGEVSASGTETVSPATTTTYEITASNSDGFIAKSVTITVVTDPPVINSFTADPSTVVYGDTSVLEWDVSGATSVTIDENIGEVDLSGSEEVIPIETTTYTLTATNSAGSVNETITVEVTSTELEIARFIADPPNIIQGETSVLEWEVKNAVYASINQSVGSVDQESGTETVYPSKTTTYTLTAEGDDGDTVTATVTVNIVTEEPEITSFDANPMVIMTGDTSVLTWKVEGASTVNITSIDYVDAEYIESGTEEVSPTSTTKYMLTATNGLGTVTDTVTVTVNDGEPVIESFSVYPAYITDQESVYLSWVVWGAETITIENVTTGESSDWDGEGYAEYSVEDWAKETTTFRLTASNEYGDSTAETTVTLEY
jgi:uncharacterized membrane-anchored protein